MIPEQVWLPPPEEQFVTREQQRQAATLGMWTFLATEVLFFGGFFVAYTAYRIWYPHDFTIASRHLDFLLGTVNTTILLTSSFFMAGAVSALKALDRRAARVLLVLTGMLGLAFLGIKGHEWINAIDEGLWPGAPKGAASGSLGVRLFFSLYFGMTGLHALHMIIGVGLIVATLVRLRGHHPLAPSQNWLTLVGLYWHFVDIIWIFLYPLLYFPGRSG